MHDMPENNDSFEALLRESEKKPLKKLSPGEKLNATIVGIDGESIFLDVGTKSEGVIESAEFIDENGELTVAIDDRVSVYCLKTGPAGQLFTRKLGSGGTSAHLEEAWRNGVPVEAQVKAEIKGGFELTLSSNVRAFCPYSQMGLRRVDDAAQTYLDTTLTVLITRFEAGGRNIVVSARALQEEERRLKKEELRETLELEQTVEGEISSIQSFGIFVDIGGMDGLVPISEVGWSRVENLHELYKVGQQVSAIIKSLDWENDRIGLSIKETLEDPWEKGVNSLAEGRTCIGTVSRLAPFGAFVTLLPGVDGLIHISRLGRGKRLNHPREAVEQGQDIEVTIESIDFAGRRVSLAPADYVSPENEAEKERQEFTDFTKKSKRSPKESPMGSFGELLKAKLAEKND
jgi:small subunit ribosomal protein S1